MHGKGRVKSHQPVTTFTGQEYISLYWNFAKEYLLSTPPYCKRNQECLISVMEWLPFKCLFWNANDSIVKLMLLAVFLCNADLVIKIYTFSNLLNKTFLEKSILVLCFRHFKYEWMKSARNVYQNRLHKEWTYVTYYG